MKPKTELKEKDRIAAEDILKRHAAKPDALIQILLDMQRKFNYLPKNVLKLISKRTGISMSYIYRVSTFYMAFSLTPRGRHLIDVCQGTACHVRGAPRIISRAQKDAGVTESGETSKDLRFTLRKVRCLGCCAMGPMIVVDGRYYGNLSPGKTSQVLSRYK